MKISTRNQLKGIVSRIQEGAINSEVEISLSDSVKITSVVTNGAVDSLGLSVGKPAYALVKSSNVIIGVDELPKISARNIFSGKIVGIQEGAINDEIDLVIENEVVITAIITKTSTKNLGLSVGGKAYAIVKASSVIIGVEE